jgi:hypothetical protein
LVESTTTTTTTITTKERVNMPGNKLQGALSKSPSNAGLTRVSPGVYRDASGKLVGQSGKMLPPRSTSQGQAAIEAANNAADQIRGQGNQAPPMVQNDLGQFGPMRNLDLTYPANTSMQNVMDTMRQGFGQRQQQQPMVPQNPYMGARPSMGFQQPRQPGQELQGSSPRISPEELQRRQGFAQELAQFASMPRRGY